MKWRYLVLLLGGCALAGLGIGLWKPKVQSQQLFSSASSDNIGSISPHGITPCAIALAPHKGDEAIDREIKRLQDEARSNSERPDTIKRLGWAFIAKARLSYDPGYYKLSEQCALCVRSKNNDDPDALLLQGHILQSLHKFKDGESIARKLVTVRNEAFDYGLLGDVLMEEGRLREAVGAYQKMIELRPDLQSYTRVAHMRWLKGDLDGAIEVMRMAVTSGSPRDPEPTAWAYTRLGIYELQAGDTETAMNSAEVALQFAKNYAAALLLRGRIQLGQGKAKEAIESLQRSADLTRLPEYEWTLADALREAGRTRSGRRGREQSGSRWSNERSADVFAFSCNEEATGRTGVKTRPRRAAYSRRRLYHGRSRLGLECQWPNYRSAGILKGSAARRHAGRTIILSLRVHRVVRGRLRRRREVVRALRSNQTDAHAFGER